VIERRAYRLPDFIGIGPPRTGTTWLHRMLMGTVGVPQRGKEVHFFDLYYSKGLRWYLDHFDGCSASKVVGEFTPDYFQSRDALERIANDIPNCKIVCTLRDPVARLYSFYKLLLRNRSIRGIDFEHSIDRHPKMLLRDHLYASLLEGWMNALGRDRVLLCFYDDLELDPQKYLDRITDFIGAARISVLASKEAGNRIFSIRYNYRRPRLARLMWRLNRALYHGRGYDIRAVLEKLGIWQYCLKRGRQFPSVDPEYETILRRRLLPDIERLEQLSRRDLSQWKCPVAPVAYSPATRMRAS
jgi:hypothetical protein